MHELIFKQIDQNLQTTPYTTEKMWYLYFYSYTLQCNVTIYNKYTVKEQYFLPILKSFIYLKNIYKN